MSEGVASKKSTAVTWCDALSVVIIISSAIILAILNFHRTPPEAIGLDNPNKIDQILLLVAICLVIALATVTLLQLKTWIGWLVDDRKAGAPRPPFRHLSLLLIVIVIGLVFTPIVSYDVTVQLPSTAGE